VGLFKQPLAFKGGKVRTPEIRKEKGGLRKDIEKESLIYVTTSEPKKRKIKEWKARPTISRSAGKN